ncbi:uncharacterized protein LOC134742309 [Cydia strobilella]|uniref:uncharacterized protein LOC134742309 n=1 Tax=Cydia strobilella TaxID=1100964 RepID=UPI003007DD4A
MSEQKCSYKIALLKYSEKTQNIKSTESYQEERAQEIQINNIERDKNKSDKLVKNLVNKIEGYSDSVKQSNITKTKEDAESSAKLTGKGQETNIDTKRPKRKIVKSNTKENGTKITNNEEKVMEVVEEKDKLLLNKDRIHIALISETWLSEEDVIKVSGYNIVRFDRDDSYGGVCMLIHKSVKIIVTNVFLHNKDIEVIGVKILNVPGLQYIVNLYCPPRINMTQNDWDQIFSLHSTETLVTGDINAHHLSWSYKTDRKGEIVYKSMFEHEYICMNDGSPTRIRLANGILQQSSPDTTFASQDIAVKINWKATNETLGSDHIVIKVTFGFNRSGSYNKKRNLKEAKWKDYSEDLEVAFDNPGEFDTVQLCYDYFLHNINAAAEKAIPWIKYCTEPNRKFIPKPYWDSSISKVVAERRLALAQLRRNPTPDNYNRLQNKEKFLINGNK